MVTEPISLNTHTPRAKPVSEVPKIETACAASKMEKCLKEWVGIALV